MRTVIKHTVKLGERWDNLAYYYYGDPLAYSRIIDANQQLSFYEVLPMGVTVYIPVLQVQPTNNEQMPPWLRGNND
ncbi:tail protein X [Avibacterium paragallinarum]|uniref:Phage Tail protein X n=1 Tax=Avibacterium paragallinarum TaxID=728 RepID=H6U8J7_AVIPA|nr:phage tail protein X [Avibacterium paragallinarum]QZP15716.1 tail protein X [Avibacterium paragallinarum]STO70128.1 phage tail fiber-like protein [Avibacterium paragallinarum]STO71397.1 phage tail fiber-like protein [Avibacterium paragallinarum]STO72488.1 phage tail fiber-like protein [Avibacterium paragallinarum]